MAFEHLDDFQKQKCIERLKKFSKDKLVDLRNKRFGQLLVLNEDHRIINSSSTWHCLCDCGKDCYVRSYHLTSKKRIHCGDRKIHRIYRFIDLSGKRYGNLTVIKRKDDCYSKSKIKLVMYDCICDCGKETIVQGIELTRGGAISCGCSTKMVTNDEIMCHYYNDYKHSARKRDLEFEPSFDQFQNLVLKNCYYCGMMNKARHIRSHIVNWVGLDRVDNEKGYLVSNIVPCCSQCNLFKGRFDSMDFINKAIDIAKNFEVKNGCKEITKSTDNVESFSYTEVEEWVI
jgi:hypothetical protein